MKITHVLTYVSEDGAFGGPTSVALAQLEDLIDQGVEVELQAGWDGISIPETRIKTTLRRALKWGKGFKFIVSPGLLLRRVKRGNGDEVFHIHLGRDFVTMPYALMLLWTKRPFVVQTHGMVMPRFSFAVRCLDAIMVRPILESASAVFVLTDKEADDIMKISRGKARIVRVANGIQALEPDETINKQPNRLIFLARLHPRKRVLAFVEMCLLLSQRGISYEALIYGPDEGDLHALENFIKEHDLGSKVRYLGPLQQGRGPAVLGSAGVFVLPSHGEVFPMTVLESLVAGTPVVTTNSSGLAELLQEHDAAIVTDGTSERMADAVEQLLHDDGRRSSLIRNGHQAVETIFAIRNVTKQLLDNYQVAIDRSRKKDK